MHKTPNAVNSREGGTGIGRKGGKEGGSKEGREGGWERGRGRAEGVRDNVRNTKGGKEAPCTEASKARSLQCCKET